MRIIPWMILYSKSEMIRAIEHAIVVQDGNGVYANIYFLALDRAS